MSQFEKHETPRPEIGPGVDVESILEQGEIAQIEELNGWRRSRIVTIKDDGKAVFKSDERERETPFGVKKDFARSKFELLARTIDRTLEFNLVPPTVTREIEGEKGSLQQLLDLDKADIAFRQEWTKVAREDELVKAAIFDYLIKAQDRGGHNFFVERDSGKVWLIDGDYIMFGAFGVRGYLSYILSHLLEKGPIALTADAAEGADRLRKRMEALLEEVAEPELKEVLEGIRKRAELLLERGSINREMI